MVDKVFDFLISYFSNMNDRGVDEMNNFKGNISSDEVVEWLNRNNSKQSDLECIVTSLEETIDTSPHSREVILDHLKQAANWQKEQILKNSEHVDVWKSSSGYIYDMTRLRDLINKVCQGEDSAKIIVVKEDKPPINKLDNKESYIEFPPVKKSSEECYSCNIIINN